MSVGRSQGDVEDNDSIHHNHHCYHHEEGQVPGEGAQSLSGAAGSQAMVMQDPSQCPRGLEAGDRQ